MKNLFQSMAAVALTSGAFTNLRAEEARRLEPLYVVGRSVAEPWSLNEQIVGAEHLRVTDSATLLGRIPGAAVVRNGPQTGIVQLRGLSGDRVGVKVDGMSITPACPNHMDPPLHYASLAQGDAVESYAGVSPVSTGGDRIGGTLNISRQEPEFSEDGTTRMNGALGASFLGSQDVWMTNADFTAAGSDLLFNYRGSAATANDLRYAGGTVVDSGFDKTSHEIEGAWRTADGFIALNAGFSATRDAGTPALPMDMVEDDAWHAGVRQKETFSWGVVENRLYVHEIDHLMDNFSLRPAGAMAMEAPSMSRDYGWTGSVTLPRGESRIRTGVDFHRNEFDAEQVAVMNGMRRDTFNDNRRSRAGLYVDWENRWNSKWTTRAGVRGDVVTSDAGQVANAILPPPGPMRDMLLADQARFNAADRSFSNWLPAATAALRFEPDETSSIELALGLTSRAPSLVERYLWTPLSASAGLADGRTYLGNLDLDPETGFEVAMSFAKEGERWHASVTPFYQTISDYIQGQPIARMDSSGKPVLQYRNIDRAELYGFEISGGYDISTEWSIEATASHVRGENEETGDDLYRIAPFHGLFDLSWHRDSWEAHLECVWAAAQNRVSDVQDESESPGYGLLNFRLAKVFSKGLRIEAGVENLLDKRYAEHLGGVNRVSGGDLAVGERIPDAGRFAYTSVSWKF